MGSFPFHDTQAARYMEIHELFNKINNSELFVPLHFIKNVEALAPTFRALKNSQILPYFDDSVPNTESIFAEEKLFPFLPKCDTFSINQRNIPRQYLMLFSEIDNAALIHLTITKFIELVDKLDGRVCFEDFVCDDREGYNVDDGEPKKEYKFTVRIFVLNEWYEAFMNKYTLCDLFVTPVPIAQGFQTTWRGRSSYYASEIVPGFLFLGDYLNGSDANQLTALSITHLVDVTGHETSRAVCASLGIEYLAVNIWDMDEVDIRAHFPPVLAFLSTAETTALQEDKPSPRVLVHCRAGWSRSTTFVLAYLLHSRRQNSLAAALRHTIQQRPMICPNDGFRRQLCAYEEELLGVRSVADEHAALAVLRKHGVLWTDQNGTQETDFDRIPICAFKKVMTAVEYDVLAGEGQQQAGDQGPAKPKKVFLKRGQGKKSVVAGKGGTSTSTATVEVSPLIASEEGANQN